MRARDPLPDGYDSVGPVHPYLAWAAVIALDLLIVFVVLTLIAMIGDTIEDAIWPGGFDWIPKL